MPMYLHMSLNTPPLSLFLRSLTCGVHTSSLSSTSRRHCLTGMGQAEFAVLGLGGCSYSRIAPRCSSSSSRSSSSSLQQRGAHTLLDRVAVVTGGNKGIGLELCRQLASEKGVTVVLTARNEQRGASAVQKLKEAGLCNVLFHQLDITDAVSISRLADFMKSRFGRIDILVNNAALGGVEYAEDPAHSSTTSELELRGMNQQQMLEWMYSKVRETSDAAKEGVRTNYYGNKAVTEALLTLLKASSDGRIVFVCGLTREIKDEELQQELDDIEKLTEERLDEVLATYLQDFEAGALVARGWPTILSAYKVAAVAMNAYAKITARRHPDLRINSANPGYVRTDTTVHSGNLTPAEGATNLLKVVLLPEGGPTGSYFSEGQLASFV